MKRLPAPARRGARAAAASPAVKRRGPGDSSVSRTPPFHRHVYALVRGIPRGQVATYGQVAAMLGHPRAARAVGQALRMLPRSLHKVVPWQRVINAAGRISYRGDWQRPDLQRDLLEGEGVSFDRSGKVDLREVRWAGTQRERAVQLHSTLPLQTGRTRRRS